MRPFDLLLVLLVESCSIAGQIFFKKSSSDEITRSWYLRFLGIGILLKATDHFLWLGLYAKYEASYLYPFDALNRILLLGAAWFFLKERATRQTLLGVVLIISGVWLVSSS